MSRAFDFQPRLACPDTNRIKHEVNVISQYIAMEPQAIITSNYNAAINPVSSRRFACDRCRAHKLRCNRDILASSNKPCPRCIKARAKCSISFSPRWGKQAGSDGRHVDHSESLGVSGEQGSSVSAFESYPDAGIVQFSDTSRMNIFYRNFETLLTQYIVNSHLQPTQLSEHTENASDTFDLTTPIPSTSTDTCTDLQEHNGGMQFPSITLMDIMDMPANRPFDSGDSLIPSPRGPRSREGNEPAPALQNHGSQLSPAEILFMDGNFPITAPPSIFTPDTQREICIQKLSDLGASLMKNLNRLSTCTLSTSFIFTPSDRNVEEYLFRAIDGSGTQDNAIGKVLRSTEEFLQILQDFRHALLDIPPNSTHQEKENGSGHTSESNSTPGFLRETHDSEEVLRRWDLLQTYKDRPRNHNDSQVTHSNPSSSTENPTHLSIPSILTLLTCYTCILKSFEGILVSLGYWLSFPVSSPLHAQVTPIIAGVQINGFTLDSYSHWSLQWKILLQVCEHMLDNLEKALWLDPGEGSGRSTVLAGPVFQGLLQVLLKQEGLESPESEGNITGMKKVRALLEKIMAGL